MNESYFLSGENGLIALEDKSLPVYLPRVNSDLNGAMFSLAGADADHFSINSVSGRVFFNDDVSTTFGDSFELTINADNQGVSSDKSIKILVLEEGIQRAIFTDEEKISGTPFEENFLDLEEKIINSITWGGRWVTDVGDETQLYYSFAEGIDPFNIVPEASIWSNDEKSDIRTALASYEKLLNIDFVEINFNENHVEFEGIDLSDSSSTANLWFWKSRLGLIDQSILGMSDVPAYSEGQPLYLELNYETEDFLAGDIGPGTEAFDTVLHELGHMLGLAHPFDGGSAEDASTVSGRYTNTYYSIMAYGTPSSSPSLNDIVALRNLYGERAITEVFNDHYDAINEMDNTHFRVWDYGGTDVLDLSSSTLSSIKDAYNKNIIYQLDDQYFVKFQDSIYLPSFQVEGEIEKLIATHSADKIFIGTQSAVSSFNSVEANGGDDEVFLQNAGQVDIYLGEGSDKFDYRPGSLRISEGLIANVLGEQGNDSFLVDFDNIYFDVVQQTDPILIYDMDDLSQRLQLSFDGGTGFDTLNFTGSSTFGVSLNLETQIGELANVSFNITEFEVISATYQDDEIHADLNPVLVFALAGDDVIYGNMGEDELYGGAGDDYLFGGAGDDLLVGDSGSDFLLGGNGNDTLYVDNLDTFDAGEGYDYVVFESPAIINNLIKSYTFDVEFDNLSKDFIALSDLHNFETFEEGFLEGVGGRIIGNNSNEKLNLSSNGYVEFFANDGNDEYIQEFSSYEGVEFVGGLGDDMLRLDFWNDDKVLFVENYSEGNDTIVADGFNKRGLDIYLPDNVENFYATGRQTNNNSRDHAVYGNDSDNKILAPAESSVESGKGDDVIILTYGSSFADGGDGNDTILIADDAEDSIVTGGSGNDLIFVEAGAELVFVQESIGNDIYVFSPNSWSSGLQLEGELSEYSFVEYIEKSYFFKDGEINLVNRHQELDFLDLSGNIVTPNIQWILPNQEQLDLINSSGFGKFPVGDPAELVFVGSQSSVNDGIYSSKHLPSTNNYFFENFEQKIELDSSSKFFSGFDDSGNLISQLALSEETITEKQSDIFFMSSNVEGYGQVQIPFAITVTPVTGSASMDASGAHILPVAINDEFNFFLTDIYLWNNMSSGYLHPESDDQEYRHNGTVDQISINFFGLPDGIHYDAATGYLNGSLESTGLYDFKLTVEEEGNHVEQWFSLFAYDEADAVWQSDIEKNVIRLGESLYSGNQWLGYSDQLYLDRLLDDVEIAHLGALSSPNYYESTIISDYNEGEGYFEDVIYQTSTDLLEGKHKFFGLKAEGLTGKEFVISADLVVPSLKDAVFIAEWLHDEGSPISTDASFALQLPEIDGELPNYARFIEASNVENPHFSSVKGVLDEETGIVEFNSWYHGDSILSDNILIYALYDDAPFIGSASVDFIMDPFLELDELHLVKGYIFEHKLHLGNIDHGAEYDISLESGSLPGVSFDSSSNVLTLSVENWNFTENYQSGFEITKTTEFGTSTHYDDLYFTISDVETIRDLPRSINFFEDSGSFIFDGSVLFTDSGLNFLDGDKLNFEASNLPEGLAIDENTGLIDGTPNNSSVGSHTVVISAQGDSATRVGYLLDVVVSNVNDSPTGTMTISGAAAEDETLTVVTSSISDEDGLGAFSYQWLANDVVITDANDSTLTLSQAEVDKAITVKVSYTDGYGATEELMSSATEAIASADLAITNTITDRFGDVLNSAEAHAYEDSAKEITATSTNDNVTVFETARGTDLLIDAAMDIDTASDRAIGAFDALQALRLAVGLDKSDGTSEWHDYIAADINKDGRVGADDALNILKFAVGLTDDPSADWVFVDGDADHSGIDRSNSDYDEGILLHDVMTDMYTNMTGILLGDVDGSYDGSYIA